MLIFHEGLPGSGKSYEAVTRNLVDAVKAGRQVLGNVRGLGDPECLDKIAEVTEVDRAKVGELVHFLTDDQMDRIWEHAPDNSLLLLDEMQNYWPPSREKPPRELLQFVTQHRQLGIDIIGMGQALKDVSALFRRRVDRKIQFETRDVVGRPEEYTWRAFKLRDPASEKFELVQTGKGRYDPALFGMYKSHKDEEVQVERLGDARMSIFSHKGLKYGIPAMVVALVVAVGYLVHWFSGGGLASSASVAAAAKPVAPRSVAPASASTQVKVEQPPEPKKPASIDPFDAAMQSGRPRLSGVVTAAAYVDGIVDVFDTERHKVESWRLKDAKTMGWLVMVTDWGVTVTKNGVTYNLTAWPMDYDGGINASRDVPVSLATTERASREQTGVLIASGTYQGVPPAGLGSSQSK